MTAETPDIPIVRRSRLRFFIVLAVVGACSLLTFYVAWSHAAQRRVRDTLDQLRADGLPITLEEVSPKAIPAARNAAVPLERAFALMTTATRPYRPPKASGQLLPEVVQLADAVVKGGAWSPAGRAEAEAFLSGPIGSAILAELHESAARGDCRFDLDYRLGLGMFLPHISLVRACIAIEVAAADLAADAGRWDDAVDRLIEGLSLARSIRQEPLSIHVLVGISAESTVMRCLHDLLVRAPPSAALVRIAAALAASDDETADIVRMLDCERVIRADWFRTHREGFDPFILGSSRSTRYLYLLYRTPLAGPQLDYEYAWLMRRLRQDRDAFAAHPLAAAPPSEEAPWWAPVADLMLVSVDSIRSTSTRRWMHVLLARTAVALMRYRSEHGNYPATLADLVPEYLPTVPLHPRFGAPFDYLVDAGGAMVSGKPIGTPGKSYVLGAWRCPP